MAGFVPYTTKGFETWSYIAGKAYGDPYQSKLIMDANPAVKLDYILPEGIVLRVPAMAAVANSVDPALLPFWKIAP